MTTLKLVRVAHDPTLSATVLARRPLAYDDAALGHVRAGSALARWGGRLAVVQDDANALAVLDGPHVRALPFPGAERSAGYAATSKATKLDLEAAVVDGDTHYAFGSGSTDGRYRVATAEGASVRLVDATAFYEGLAAERGFSGGALNVEGAVLVGENLTLFQRGNGAPTETTEPVSATCTVDWPALRAFLEGRAGPPAPRDVVRYDLGEAASVPLSFTDAARTPSGAMAFLAAAEGSPNAYDDGPVTGVAIGLLSPGAPRLALIREVDGRPFLDKAEGLAFDPARPGVAFVVTDRDDPALPAELVELALVGFS